MGTFEKSTLRWDGFLANTRNAYRELRWTSEFSDLTLVGGDGKQVRAHQVIMAGGSSFIRKILIQNPHPHPLIYLKDVNYEHLLSLLDFVYTGEADIIDDHLKEFLDIAEDLKVKGLTLEKSVDQEPKSHLTIPASLQHWKAQELGLSRKVWHPRSPISSQNPKPTDNHAPAPDASHLRNVMSATSRGAAATEVNHPTPDVSHLSSAMSATSQGPASTGIHHPTPRVSRSVVSTGYQGAATTEVNPPTPMVSNHCNVMSATSRGAAATEVNHPMPDESHLCSVKSVAFQGPTNNEVNHPMPDESHLRSLKSVASQGPTNNEVNRPTHVLSNHCSVMFTASQCPTAIEVTPPTPVVSRSTPHHGHVAAESRASHLHCVKFAPQGKAATEERSSKNPPTVTSSSNSKKFPQYDSDKQVDYGDAYNVKVEVDDTSHNNVYKAMNEHGESSVSNVSRGVDNKTGAAVPAMDQEEIGQSFSTEQLITEIKVEVVSSNNEQSVEDWYKHSDESDTIMAQDEYNYTQVESELLDSALVNEELAYNSFGDMQDEEQDLSEKKAFQQKRSHAVKNSSQCSVCLKVLSTSVTLKRHMRVHTVEKPYRCQVCSKMFTHCKSLVQHKRLHTGENPYQCPLCPKSFRQRGHLNKHKRIHTGEKPYQCPLCPKTFSRQAHMNSHKRIHTGEKPYQCPLCPKTFSTSSNLNTHKRFHTGEKPYKCPLCPKAFSTSSSVDTHKRIHTGEKPYKCPRCPKLFSQKGSLDRHIKVHGKKKKCFMQLGN